MKAILLAIFIVACSTFQSEQCLKIEVGFLKSQFAWEEKKSIEFQVENGTIRPIALPDWLFGGTKEDQDSEYFIELLMKDSTGVYKEVELMDEDYQYIINNRKFQVLKPGESIKYHASMDLLHDLTHKGAYKVRIIVRSQKLIDCGNLVPSKWQDFEVK